MEQLEIIQRTIEEHHKIHSDLNTVGEAINDFEAIFRFQHVRSQLGQSSAPDVNRHIENLHNTIKKMDAGLQKHFSFEEKYLPEVLGTNLMKAILYDHDEIRGHLLRCKTAITGDFVNISREELLARRNHVQQLVHDLIGEIESHAGREETVLKMIEKALKKDQGL